MTPDTLRKLRESRNLTREELAQKLNCSASAIVQWELAKREIPAWVEKEMMQGVELTFPLDQLNEMMNIAREMDMSFEDLLKESIQHALAARRSKPLASTVSPEAMPQAANIVPLPSPSELNKPRDIAAEPQATGTGPQMRKPATYDSLKRPKK